MESFDVAVIGAGVTGVATARRLALSGQRVLLLEKGGDILSGASKANSALLHTGFDAPEGSLELRCMQAGYAEFMDLRGAMNLPVLLTGAMVVAWTEVQEAALPGILAAAHRNGVADARPLTGAEVLHREPNLSPDARAGVLVPGEVVIDPWSPFHGYAAEILAKGNTILRGAEVTGGSLTARIGTCRPPKAPSAPPPPSIAPAFTATGSTRCCSATRISPSKAVPAFVESKGIERTR